VVQALAAGNAVIAVAPLARRVLAPLLDVPMLPLAVLDGTCPAEVLATLPVSVVACGGSAELRAPLRRALAEWEGPIVLLIAETLAPAAYYTECTICIDTTAAGGNASLLAEASL